MLKFQQCDKLSQGDDGSSAESVISKSKINTRATIYFLTAFFPGRGVFESGFLSLHDAVLKKSGMYVLAATALCAFHTRALGHLQRKHNRNAAIV